MYVTNVPKSVLRYELDKGQYSYSLEKVSEFTLIEFKDNAHCFYSMNSMKYWRN